MADNRKNNGNKGHSTKAKGLDRRKNPYKNIVQEVVTVDKLADVLKMLLGKAIEEQDIPASKLLLEYALGKPTEKKDITINEIQPLFPDEL
jgi:hypothetical protein